MKFLKWFGIIIGSVILSVLLTVGLALLTLSINAKMNKTVSLTEYTFTHEEIPRSFSGFKIMVISDLHEAPFAEQILAYIHREKPDAIAFTGDMVQLPGYTVDETLKIAENVDDIPMYAISGNHDRQCDAYWEIMGILRNNNISTLENDSVYIERGTESILLQGVEDPKDDVVSEERIEQMRTEIKNRLPDEPCFSVLLMHRADLYPEIKDTGVDLILSGHLHGGIIRLPFVGGLVGQNGFERNLEYEYGFYQDEGSAAMIVSGGCDQNPEKKRFLNPPEVVLVTLERGD